MKPPTQEEYEDQNILKIEITVEAQPWDLSIHDFTCQEQTTFDYRGRFFSPNTPAYAYDAADVMNDDNYATVLESFVGT